MIANFLQRQIIFHPLPLEQSYQYDFDADFEELNLTSKDGTTINALYFKTKEPRKGVILYSHGNADNLKRWGGIHVDFLKHGYDLFVWDYRGFGKSESIAEEANMYADGQMTYDYVRGKFPAEEIIIYGRSLGGAVASYLASKNEAKLLILETPFNNMRSLFQIQMPLLPKSLELDFKFPNDEHIQKVKYPIYIFQGTSDWVVPYESASRLKAHLKPTDEFITIPRGGHKNLAKFELYHVRLKGILK